MELPELLDTKQAAQKLGCSASLLKRWRADGTGPKFIQLGPHLVRYTSEDIQEYLAGLPRLSSNAEAYFASRALRGLAGSQSPD
jgi:predicted DNA-binding transcriptional regulator AlpA